MSWARHPTAGAVVAVIAVAWVVRTARNDSGEGFYERAERSLLDTRFVVRGPTPPDPALALVVMDDRTVETQPELFARRAGWAQVVRAVHAAGAKVIGIDAIFSQPEQPLGAELSSKVRAWALAHPEVEPDDASGALLAEVAKGMQGDDQLAAALREADPVVLALFAGDTGSAADEALLGRSRYAQSTAGPRPPRLVQGLDTAIPALVQSARAMGFATNYEDETHSVRQVPLAVSWHDGIYFPLAVPIVAAHLRLNRGQLAYLGPLEQVKLGDRTLALDDNQLWLNYRGGQGTFDTFSAVDVVQGKVEPGRLAGKTVLIGVTRLGYDQVKGPFSQLPGVEVQATAIDNILHGDTLRRSSHVEDLAVTLAIGLALAALFAFRRSGIGLYAAGWAVLTVGWVVGSQLVFQRRGLWLPLAGPLASTAAAFVVGVAISFTREAGQRRYLKKAFSNYLGEDALDQLLAKPGLLALGGERRQLSVLFSDICGFTTLSEKLAPDQLVAFLNTYLSPMTRAVLAQGGLLDKYIGDAVMAVFGAPVPLEDHAARALTCALTMHRELEALNAGPLQALGEPLAIGVGVNTGDMVVGNMGSEDRFDYTVAGDSVNLASRLEGLTRTYGVFCLVGEAARRAAGESFAFRALDQVQVKGKHVAVEVFELLNGPGRVVSAPAQLEAWNAGLAAWRSARLSEARAQFSTFAAANPADVPVKLYLERLAVLPETAPEGFSPVAVFNSK